MPDTLSLCQFLDRCHAAGVITDRQMLCLIGAGQGTGPVKILHVLTRRS